MLDYIENNIAPRMLYLLMASVFVLTALGSYLYVFKKPIKEYQQQQRSLAMLNAEQGDMQPLNAKLQQLQQELVGLRETLNGKGPDLPVNQMIAYVIGQLDLVASRHDVQLVSVKPGKTNDVFMFNELPFNVEITGSYFSLYEWLQDIEKELGPMVIKQFRIDNAGHAKARHMKLLLVSYRGGLS